MSAESKEAAKALRSRMWKTRGSRFVAQARYRGQNLLSIWSISVLSIYVIALSLVALLFEAELNHIDLKVINAANVVLSVCIIAFSLIEFSRDYLGAAEAMNSSALEIGRLYGEISVRYEDEGISQEEVAEFDRRYSNILEKYPNNHRDMDYRIFQMSNPRQFNEWWVKCIITRAIARVVICLRVWMTYLFAMLAPLLGAIVYYIIWR
ncbi:SLATT domain-containing protein [Labrys monachus]|uniref:SMODS and SLOG-associating 2TM effector domain-containing protein n=1 Tax=Labrys monachus TaxID=217067 RepID=A0ABU0FCQ9_9HYPH|nr:hypothetical protein [Labrys monachus]